MSIEGIKRIGTTTRRTEQTPRPEQIRFREEDPIEENLIPDIESTNPDNAPKIVSREDALKKQGKGTKISTIA